MKDQIHALLANRVRALSASGALPLGEPPLFVVEPPRNPAHGDFSANLPLVLARAAKRPPLAVAARLLEGLRLPDFVASVEILPPGFINFRLKPAAILDVLLDILRGDARYGQSDACAGQSLQIEFVSANPTGPLHVGHGRGAAYGSALARLLRAVGCAVQTEYYVNDAGRQMDILALSVWLRYLETFGAGPALPDNAYRGAYIRDIAGALRDLRGARFVPADSVCLPENAEPEARLDGAIARCREVLGETDYSEIHRHACAAILAGIRADLAAFGVHFDRWYSERDLIGSGQLASALADLRQRGFITDRDGAQWFTSSRFGDEKDRVVVRENGAATYFATDIAYHTEKMARGYSGLINIWGADHHGYIPRIKAALSALGLDPERLQVLLVQFATLYRQGERVQMSTRSGEFVTLRELLEEVGPDAGRFFYLMRRSEQHLDFDLDLAKSQSQDNPVYYLQYAHARICSVLRQVQQQQLDFDEPRGLRERALLCEKKEQALATLAGRYPQVVASAASEREPHQVANYLRELAMEFHGYYNAHKILIPDAALRDARLVLCQAVRIVLRNGLDLLGVAAPEEM